MSELRRGWIWLLVLGLPGITPAQGREATSLKGHDGWVGGIAFSADNKYLATASADRTVRLWAARRRTLLGTFRGHEDVVCAVTFSPDGRLLATGSFDHTVRLWSITPRKAPPVRHVFKGHRGAVLAVAFSPDGKLLATGSIDGTVHLWDVASRREAAT